MVHLVLFTVSFICAHALMAFPLTRRISEIIDESTSKWQSACINADGGLVCNDLSVKSFDTLLAAALPCAQQDAADGMIDLAKQLKSQEMIRLTQIFVQQPRITPYALSVPYCQSPPRNPELKGLYQCQFQGSNATTFVGNVPVGGNGTVPFGMTAPLDPPGSCLAHPQGPIPDGMQLVDLVADPFASRSKGSQVVSRD